ncbi:MAG: metal ABC transporter permease [Deltaproteobacteria bacterium]|nr:metal ABC transporter permease [Deltaproteobacteria bacterium]
MPSFFDYADIWGNQLVAGAVAGLLCGYLGVWVVLRRVVFVAAALGEVAGFGVVFAFFVAGSLAAGEADHPTHAVHQAPAEEQADAEYPGGGPHGRGGARDGRGPHGRQGTRDGQGPHGPHARRHAPDAPPAPGPAEPAAAAPLSDDDLTALLAEVGVEGAGTAVGTASAADAGAEPAGADAGADAPVAAPSRTAAAVFGAGGVKAYVPTAESAARDNAAGAGGHAAPPVPVWLQPMVVALVFVIVAAALLSWAPNYRRITQESVVGLAYLVAAGMVILVGSRIPQGTHEIRHVLYGDSVSLDAAQLYGLLVAGAVVAAVHGLFFKEFLFVSFDPETARAVGVRTGPMNVLLLVSIGIVIASASRAVGALPVFASLVLPPIAALLCMSSLRGALVLSAVLGAVASVLGYYLAWIWSLPAGATRAVTAAAFIVPALLVRWLRRN